VVEGEVVEVVLDFGEFGVDFPGDAVDDPLGEDDWWLLVLCRIEIS